MSTLTWSLPNDSISSKVNEFSEMFNITEKLSDGWSKLTTTSSERVIHTISQNHQLSGWEGVITSDYGLRMFQGKEEFHRGIDIAVPSGTPLESNISGKVIASGEATSQGYHDSYGNIVVVQDSFGREHLYGHLERTTVNVGDTVDLGTTIGLIGSTGNSTGSHLHYQIMYDGMAIDPSSFLYQAQNGTSSTHVFTPTEYREIQPLTSEDVKNLEVNGGNADGNLFDGITNFVDFINTARKEGLSVAIWGKPFDEVVIDGIGAFFGAIFKGLGLFITQNSDLFFLAPSLLFLFLTFIVGRNRFTKWILPLTIFYVCSKALYFFLISEK